MSAPLLEVRDLRVAYGKVEALHGVSLAVSEGRIVTVIGPNGAGKSTLLNSLAGLMPSKGEVLLRGRSLADVGTEARVGEGLVLVPEKRELFGAMSVEDNLVLGAFARLRRRGTNLDTDLKSVYARFPRLEERKAQYAATLSGGERQMLALGRALMGQPKVLMLDEPSLGLAPFLVDEIFDIIRRINTEQKTAVLLVEQNAAAALDVAHSAYLLENGRVVMSGTAEVLRANPDVQNAYLGGVGHVDYSQVKHYRRRKRWLA